MIATRGAAMKLSLILLLLPLVASAAPAPVLVGPYLQRMSADAVVVVWETDPPQAADLEIDLPDGTRTLHATAELHHELAVTQLPAGHFAYRLRLADGVVGQGRLHALPSGPAATDYTFIVYGDNRDRDADHRAVVEAMLDVPAEFALETGDMTGDANDQALWRRFFAIEQPFLSSTPMYPAIGNHELLGDPTLASYQRYFVLPLVPGRDDAHADHERYYSFVVGDSVFVALDANQPGNRAQAAFLHRALSEAAARGVHHSFVFFHQPSFSVGQFCGSAVEQGMWVPEFEEHHVTAVFTGHEHAYQHLERNGVRYFVVGGGGAPLIRESGSCPAYDRAAKRLFRSTHQFVRVDVRGDAITLTSIGVHGDLIEKVDLSVGASAPSPEPPVPFVDASPDHPAQPRVAARRQHHVLVGVVSAAVLLLALAVLLGGRRKRHSSG